MNSPRTARRGVHVPSLLAGGALVLVGVVAAGGRTVPTARAALDTAGANVWGLTVPTDGWAIVRGQDGLAYEVTREGWRRIGEGGKGPLQLP